MSKINFDDTSIAFAGKTDDELSHAHNLFRLMQFEPLVNIGSKFTEIAFNVGLPISYPIKLTIFDQFCGGTDIQECLKPIKKLSEYGVHTILDYGAEAKENEKDFDKIASFLIENLKLAEEDPDINIISSKITGLMRFHLLEKISNNEALNETEQAEWERGLARVKSVSQQAYDCEIQIYYDAEESWIQDAIDQIVIDHSKEFNKEKPIIFNTVQLYRHDRLAFLKSSLKNAKKDGYILAVKIVRGAYMEKENKRADEMDYPTPIQADKAATDKAYNEALLFCIDNIDHLAFCNATHNENSCKLLAETVQAKSFPNDHPHIFSSQLYGMSDNLSFNMAKADFNVAKYMPYGPVKEVIPYLIRRARENTAVNGQLGRELGLIKIEMGRRNLL